MTLKKSNIGWNKRRNIKGEKKKKKKRNNIGGRKRPRIIVGMRGRKIIGGEKK